MTMARPCLGVVLSAAMKPALGSQRPVLKSQSSAPSHRPPVIGPQLSALIHLHSVIGKQSREEFDTAHSSHPRPTTGLLIGRNQDKQDSFVVAPGAWPGEAL